MRHIKFLNLNFTDRPSTDLEEPVGCLQEFLTKTEYTKESKLLIYCGSGMSRSPSMAVGLLMTRSKFSYEDAMTLMKSARGRFLQINHGFLRQLKALEYC